METYYSIVNYPCFLSIQCHHHLKLYNPVLEISAPQNGGVEPQLHVSQL